MCVLGTGPPWWPVSSMGWSCARAYAAAHTGPSGKVVRARSCMCRGGLLVPSTTHAPGDPPHRGWRQIDLRFPCLRRETSQAGGIRPIPHGGPRDTWRPRSMYGVRVPCMPRPLHTRHAMHVGRGAPAIATPPLHAREAAADTHHRAPTAASGTPLARLSGPGTDGRDPHTNLPFLEVW